MAYYPEIILFILFDLKLFLFGFILLFFIFKKKRRYLEKEKFHIIFIESYTLGYFIYLNLSYFLNNFITFSRWYSDYFFLLIILSTIIISKDLRDFILERVKTPRSNPLNKRIIGLFVFSFIFFMGLYYVYYFKQLNLHYSLTTPDEYFWEANIYNLIHHGFLNKDLIKAYPPGFVYYNAAVFIQQNTHTILHYHYLLKAAVLYNYGRNVIIFFQVLVDLFGEKRPLPIFTGISSLFAFSYYIAGRQSFFLPTIQISFFTFMMLSILGNPSIPNVFYGLVLGSILLNHPLLGGIFFLIYLGYIGYKSIIDINQTKDITKNRLKDKDSTYQNLNMRIKKVYENLKNEQIFLIILIAIIPILLLAFYIWFQNRENFIGYYEHYFSIIAIKPFYDWIKNLLKTIYKIYDKIIILNSIDIYGYIDNKTTEVYSFLNFIIYLYSFNKILFISSFIMLYFIPLIKHTPERFHNIIRFTRIFYLFSAIIVLTPIFKIISEFFYLAYRYRILELLSIPLMFFNGLIMYLVIEKFPKLYDRMITKRLKINSSENKDKNSINKILKINTLFKRSLTLFIIGFLLVSILYTDFTLSIKRDAPYEKSFADQDELDMVIFKIDMLYHSNFFDPEKNRNYIIADENDSGIAYLLSLYFSKNITIFEHNFSGYTNILELENYLLQNKTNSQGVKNELAIISSENAIFDLILNGTLYHSEIIYNSSNYIILQIN